MVSATIVEATTGGVNIKESTRAGALGHTGGSHDEER
jgi:hypothetical protein